jgi:hypothetical protein
MASLLVADRLRENAREFVSLELYIDENFDTTSFLDLVFSFRFNYTLESVKLVRRSISEDAGSISTSRRTSEEIKMLLVELLKLPKLKTLSFKNFWEEDLKDMSDIIRKSKRVQ